MRYKKGREAERVTRAARRSEGELERDGKRGVELVDVRTRVWVGCRGEARRVKREVRKSDKKKRDWEEGRGKMEEVAGEERQRWREKKRQKLKKIIENNNPKKT